MPGALRIDGPMSLEEAYPAFQFAVDGGFIPGLPEVVARLDLPGTAAAAWLITPQPELGSRSALEWLSEGRAPSYVLDLLPK